jgi:hypothetical protein
MTQKDPVNVELGLAEISLQLLAKGTKVMLWLAPNGAMLSKHELGLLINALERFQKEMT